MSMQEALKIIVAKSPHAGRNALAAMQAIQASSPVAHIRYLHVVQDAFADGEATFTAEDRAIIAEALTIGEDEGPRSRSLPAVRVTSAEYAEIEAAAQAAGLSISEYVRRRVLAA